MIGSLNLDLIASVEQLARAGETVVATSLIRRFGGKGANQAIAAARQGAIVHLIGCLGDDRGRRDYRFYLEQQGVDCSGVAIHPQQPTGTAMIAVAASGENSIVTAAGANSMLDRSTVRGQREPIENAGVLLCQWEIPTTVLVEAVEIANNADIPDLFNPYPVRGNFPWGSLKIDTLIVNEHEARSLFGSSIRLDSPREWEPVLRSHSLKRVVVTRGCRSTICISDDARLEIPVMVIDPVDTVGAGDAFAGTLAAWSVGQADFADAIAAGNCAGGLATLKPGAQEAIPTGQLTRHAMSRLAAV